MSRQRLYASDAERMAAYRARHDLLAVTVHLPADLVRQLYEWMKFKTETKNQVFERLIKSQLLRKR